MCSTVLYDAHWRRNLSNLLGTNGVIRCKDVNGTLIGNRELHLLSGHALVDCFPLEIIHTDAPFPLVEVLGVDAGPSDAEPSTPGQPREGWALVDAGTTSWTPGASAAEPSTSWTPGQLRETSAWRVQTSKTPGPGWTVHAFEYVMTDFAAHMFLAAALSSSGSVQRSVQFWFCPVPTAEPTEFHGDWYLNAHGQLYINFNGRGLVTEPGQWPRRCRGTNLVRTGEGTFEGKDWKGRSIRLVYQSTWTVAEDSSWIPLPGAVFW